MKSGSYEHVYPDFRPASNLPNIVVDKRIMDPGVAQEISLPCQLRKTPLLLYQIFTALTQQIYSAAAELALDVCATWSADPNETSIWIGPEFDFTDTLEIRPAIYIKLGQITYKSLTGRHDGKMHLDLEQGEYHYTRNGTGSVTWVHIANTNAEAVALSGNTFDYMDAFSDVIRDDFAFDIFTPQLYNPLSHVEESDERLVSSFTFTFSFQDTWTIKLESQKLKEIVFRARQQL